jgi:hypothetical protein|tara:strand:- start:987 stop:1319 length:333 start_codon:yes stop_codon:yes gene_type:complete
MTQQQLIELVQQMHPEIGETQIRLMLNQALDEFDHHVKLASGVATVTAIADQRYYNFTDFEQVAYTDHSGTTVSAADIAANDDVLEVSRVDYAGKIVKRSLGEPVTTDLT